MTILGQSRLRLHPSIQAAMAAPTQKCRTPLASTDQNAQPLDMSPSKPLIVVANAFERERTLARQAPARIMWTRAELTDLLGCYGRHVAAGIWRDYAIDDGTEHASFSVFRHSSEVPLYVIEKIPALRRKQGEYCVRGMDKRVLRRGHSLDALLRFFDRKSLRVLS